MNSPEAGTTRCISSTPTHLCITTETPTTHTQMVSRPPTAPQHSPQSFNHLHNDPRSHDSASQTLISQSQLTLCLQPPCDGDEYYSLSSSAPTSRHTSTHSLQDSSSNSYTSIYEIEDSHPSIYTVSASPSTLPDHPLGSSLYSGSL